MHSHIRFLMPVAAAVLLLAQAPAQAQSNTFKFGVIRYDPHSTSDGITGIGVPPGADSDVKPANTLLLTYERELVPNVGIELVLGVPPKVKTVATGSVAYLGEVLTAKNIAPALIMNYHFGQAGSAWRPYLGLGVNYTHFGSPYSPYGWQVHLADSMGMLIQGGIDYALSPQWGLFASAARVDVRTKLVAVGATVLQSDINLRPWTYQLGASYKF
ncbi:MAG: OmpW family protein [Burkholderiales bacterium]|nr:outer membrane beta-barrel protein [Burkholderiales bacterium]MDE1926958.1 OmpW family protein [Burkholderiales bacterium]MDE2157669.1 OmpW family protein [Burkholderiales bacterium]MDE2503034.1 OmpW family protein [Burkholderiales bacterium]